MWMSRESGKQLWYSPVCPHYQKAHARELNVRLQEQFTTEWKHVTRYPPLSAKVAGKYSWKTNMFQLAQVMWCLITHCQPPDGPVPELVSLQPQGSDEASDNDQTKTKAG